MVKFEDFVVLTRDSSVFEIAMAEEIAGQDGTANESIAQVVFFCVNEDCNSHRIVEFTLEELREFLLISCEPSLKEKRLLAGLIGHPIGMLVYCDRCSAGRDYPYKNMVARLRTLVKPEIVDAVEVALRNEIFWITADPNSTVDWFHSSRDLGIFRYCVTCTTDYYDSYYGIELFFTGRVQQVDLSTFTLTYGDLETFFGFTKDDAMEKRDIGQWT